MDKQAVAKRSKSISPTHLPVGSGLLHRKTEEHDVLMLVPPIVHEVLRSPSQALDPATRAFFEPRFGHDFSKVRVHTDATAAESAQAVNTLAYTAGKNVVFGKGRSLPKAADKRELLAHELTHVVQQTILLDQPTSSSDDLAEREAEQNSQKVMDGQPMQVRTPQGKGSDSSDPKNEYLIIRA
jgi:hypothetical protein